MLVYTPSFSVVAVQFKQNRALAMVHFSQVIEFTIDKDGFRESWLPQARLVASSTRVSRLVLPVRVHLLTTERESCSHVEPALPFARVRMGCPHCRLPRARLPHCRQSPRPPTTARAPSFRPSRGGPISAQPDQLSLCTCTRLRAPPWDRDVLPAILHSALRARARRRRDPRVLLRCDHEPCVCRGVDIAELRR